jgi:hypothetical protein
LEDGLVARHALTLTAPRNASALNSEIYMTATLATDTYYLIISDRRADPPAGSST